MPNQRTLLLFGLLLLLGGCAAGPLQEVVRGPIESRGGLTLGDVEGAIIRAGERSGWEVAPVRPGLMRAEHREGAGNRLAVVDVHYDASAYQIRYSDSANLRYRAGGMRFDPAAYMGNGAGSGPVIHKDYNRWVEAFDRAIRSEFKSIALEGGNGSDRGALAGLRSGEHRCDDLPEAFMAEQGTVAVSSANLRSGAGIGCPRIGSLGGGAAVEILGRKGDWYLISSPEGGRAWIFSKLVKSGAPAVDPSGTARIRSVDMGAPETGPADDAQHKIPIAVFRFKPLNRETLDAGLGEMVRAAFAAELVDSKMFDIVEPQRLDRAVKKTGRNPAESVETAEAVEIGRGLKAKAVVTGSVVLLSNGRIQINVRTVDVDDARAIGADSRIRRYSPSNVNAMVREMAGNSARRIVAAE